MLYSPNGSKTVAVVGAGVMGVVAALTMQVNGFQVTLFDREAFPPSNTSMVAAGMLAPFSESDILPYAYIGAGLEGIDLWQTLLGDLHSDCLFRSGSLVLEEPGSHSPAFETLRLEDEAIPLSRLELFREEPALAPGFEGGILLPQEAYLLPDIALRHLFARFMSAGGQFEISEIDPLNLLGFSRVLDCRGFIDGLAPDMTAVQGELIIVETPKPIIRRPIRMLRQDTPFYLVPRPNGHIAIGATAIRIEGMSDYRIRTRSILSLLDFACETIPGLADTRLVGTYSGVRAAYPNLLPRLQTSGDGHVIGLNGLYRHGFLLAPVMAQSALRRLQDVPDPNASLFDGMTNNPAPNLQT
jgi:glycine oxidase